MRATLTTILLTPTTCLVVSLNDAKCNTFITFLHESKLFITIYHINTKLLTTKNNTLNQIFKITVKHVGTCKTSNVASKLSYSTVAIKNHH